MDVPADELVGLQQDQEEPRHGREKQQRSHQERRQGAWAGGNPAPAADVPTTVPPHPLAAATASVRGRRSLSGGAAAAAVPADDGQSDADADADGGEGGGAPGGSYTPLQPGWLLVCRLLVRGGMEAVEGSWSAWGGEAVLLALLLSAFTACSVASVALMAAVGWGMAAG